MGVVGLFLVGFGQVFGEIQLPPKIQKAYDYIHEQQQTNPIKVLDYYLSRYANEVNFAQWWDKRFPEADLFVMSNRYGSIDDLNCEKNKKRYIHPTKERSPSCFDPVSYFKSKHNFPDPTKTQRHYFDRYDNEPKWKAWFDKWFEGYTLKEIVGFLDPVVIPLPIIRQTGYNINDHCELAYAINYNRHFEVFGSRSEVLQEPNNQKEIFERIFNEEREKFESKYEDWELEAGLFDPDDFNEYREQASFRANSEIIDKVIELNNINPGLKQILLEREIGSADFDEQIINRNFHDLMLHPDYFGKNKKCERQMIEHFGNDVYYYLIKYYGESRAEILFNEIISRIEN